MQTTIKSGDTVECIFDGLLEGNKKGPKIKKGKSYEVKEVFRDQDGHDHLDVGLVSELEYVSCHETKREIPRGESIHWCHPSRFK